MSEVEVQEVDCVKKKKKKSDEEEEEVEKETPPDKMDLFGEPAMNNAYLICHNVQVYIYTDNSTVFGGIFEEVHFYLYFAFSRT